jgi:hypothetical protein
MTTFNYSHGTPVQGSSLVRAVYFNSATKQLVIDLNGSLYLYDNCSYTDYRLIVDAPSAGAAYNTFQNSKAERASYLGTTGSVTFQQGLDLAQPLATAPPVPAHVGTDDVKAQGGMIFELRPEVAEPAAEDESLRSHTVVFTINGGPDEYEYNIDNTSVDGAVEAFSDISKAMGVEFTALRVVTHLNLDAEVEDDEW